MESTQEMSSQEKENLAGDVLGSLGEPEGSEVDVNQNHGSDGQQNSNPSDPVFVQKRLKQQKRAHEREIRELHARISEMQAAMGSNQPQYQDQSAYQQPGQVGSGNGIDDSIRKAVSFALQQKELEERKAKEAEAMAYVNRQHDNLKQHLNMMGDKYDDFDDIVKGDDMPYTTHMANAALMLPQNGPGSAGEVLYKLGKNPEELKRIAQLHPLEQAREMVKLSHALIAGGNGDQKNGGNIKPLGQIKGSPNNQSSYISDKTPISDLRKRMKNGWK